MACVYVYEAIEMDTKMLTVLLHVEWLEVLLTLVCVIWFIFQDSVLFVEGKFMCQKS